MSLKVTKPYNRMYISMDVKIANVKYKKGNDKILGSKIDYQRLTHT